MNSDTSFGQCGANSDRLQVGIGVLHGSGEDRPPRPAAEALVAHALRTVDTERLLVRGVLLFATADWCRTSDRLPSEVRSALAAQLGYEVPLIGGSMAKMYCWADPEPMIDPGLLLVAVCSNDICMTVGLVEKPYGGTDDERRQNLKLSAAELEGRAGVRLGSGADRHLFGVFPGIIRDEHGNLIYCDNELFHEVLAAFNFRYPLVGGAAADHIDPTTGYQFADDRCVESGLALAVVESDLGIGVMMGHGFSKRQQSRVTVDALAGGADRGYGVTRLDGKPSREYLEKLKKDRLTWFGRPVFGLPGGPDCDVAVTLPQTSDRGDAVWFNRPLSLGDSLFLLDSNDDDMIENGKYVIERARHEAEAEIADIGLLLVFGCTGRYELFAKHHRDWQAVVEQVRRRYPGVPFVVVLCAGEFGSDRWRRPRCNNMSLAACCLSSVYARQSRTRNLESLLLRCATRLALCQTPKDVMEATLRGAGEAGATGGQICIVDKTIVDETVGAAPGIIVGRELGCAFRAPGWEHDWDAVAKLTLRAVPKSQDGDFPASLRGWARPVKAGVELRLVRDFTGKEDILTRIVRTLHAVFVEDIHDPKFACDIVAGEAGNIKTHMAIPMLGSDGEAIATLQISFRDGTFIDGASFDAWIGYAQKAAAALERAYEAEERRITEAISNLGNRIIQTPVSLDAGPHAWCQEYVGTVREILDADDVHIRLLAEGRQGDEYRLIAEDGFLKDIRFRTRPITREGDGSCNRALLLGGGVITNRRDRTNEINKDVQSLADDGRLGQALLNRLQELESTAMLPILHEEQLWGSFVIDSKRPYFFTERRQRTAEFAAKLAGAILRGKTSEHERLWLDNEKNWMLKTLGEARQASSGERLRWFIQRLCESLGADVASVFLWYETPRRLILHTSHRWAVPRTEVEGRASYRLGEGWTGDLPMREDEVSVVGLGTAKEPKGSKKYQTQMIPKEYLKPAPDGRDTGEEEVPRIGLRLNASGHPLAVITFAYYPQNVGQLQKEHRRKAATLRAFSRVLTLAIEAVEQEMVQQRIRELNLAKAQVYEGLMAAARPDGDWQPVVNAIRTGFSAQRANFWPLQQNRFQRGWSSQATQHLGVTNLLEGLEPFGAFREVIYRKRSISVTPERDGYLLEQWPDRQGVKALLAVPVICSGGEVRGVLALVNRSPTPDHPFQAFDDYERQAAEEIGRALGATLDSRERQLQAAELESRLATAMRIGAAALSGAMVMHRLMTPFALIQSSVDWLRCHPDATAAEREIHLQQIQQSCSEAVSMIQQTTTTGVAEKRPERVRALVRQAIQAVQPKLVRAAVRMELHNDCLARVFVDPYSIVGALVNLLSNALDAMGEVGTLRVVSELAVDGRTAVILICNTGPVVRDEQIAAFFQPGHSSKDRKEHLGFGLPVAKRAIEEAGGNLEMRPIAEGGVDARVTLPVAD